MGKQFPKPAPYPARARTIPWLRRDAPYGNAKWRMGFSALDIPRALRPGAAQRDHQFGKGMENPHTLSRKSIHLTIPPQSRGAVFVSRIENSPIIKYLDVKEAEASIPPARLCAAGLDVSKDADQVESSFGIATF